MLFLGCVGLLGLDRSSTDHLKTEANKYRPKFAKVTFLHLSVILCTGGVSASVHAGMHTLLGADTPFWEQTPPSGSRHPLLGADTPWEQTSPGADTPLPLGADLPSRRLLLRTVRILLECILDGNYIST